MCSARVLLACEQVLFVVAMHGVPIHFALKKAILNTHQGFNQQMWSNSNYIENIKLAAQPLDKHHVKELSREFH